MPRHALPALLPLLALGCQGAEPCTVTDNGETVILSCPDAAPVTLQDGDDGEPGQSGATGPEGATGPTGSTGADGQTSLIDLTDEPPGSNCANGGVRIDVGIDNGDGGGTASNGVLEPGEIDQTEYICDGDAGSSGAQVLVDITSEPAGLNCANGGLRVDSGLDDGDGGGTANNGVLEPGEVDTTGYICNGTGGSATLPGFAGSPGPDLSAQGWAQCAGIAGADAHTVMGVDFYGDCAGYSEILFACSADDDTTAEYTAVPVTIDTVQLTDGTCDDWTGGSNSIFGGDFILSIDSTDPGCSNFNVAYDMYVHFGTQWGCNGVTNTDFPGGGRMWAYVR